MIAAHALVFLCAVVCGCAAVPAPTPAFTYEPLPAMPEEIGVSGYSAGVVEGQLVVVGGNNFPSAPPWAGGERQHYDTIRWLDLERRTWRSGATPFPIKVSYAAAGTLGGALIITGGATPAGLSARTFALWGNEANTTLRELSPLPVALSHAGSVVIGERVYIVGGLLANGESTDRGWSGKLNASRDAMEWAELPPLPGPARHLAVVGTDGTRLFVFSGMRSRRSPSGSVTLEKPYLRDAYVLELGSGDRGVWCPLPDLPTPVAAAPGPAAYLPSLSTFFIFGGLAGDDVGLPLDNYPPFTTAIQTYAVRETAWHRRETALPVAHSRVTASLVPWREGFILFAGEIAPGKRSNQGVFIRVGVSK
ncbi:MAG: hypothetical protein V4773_16685 [Verrucomicrobiota bacterium]